MTIALDDVAFDISPARAREAFQEYRRAVRQGSTDPNDALLLESYREIMNGRRVLDVAQAMKQAGLNRDGSPRLAIIRADYKLCYAGWDGPQLWFSHHGDWKFDRRIRKPMKMPVGCPLRPNPFYWNGEKHISNPANTWSGRAVVPSIPPRFRPDRHLRHYHILWEAEWESMPVDPLLLKHLGGTMYAVMAQWDLTPLESALLRDRLEAR